MYKRNIAVVGGMRNVNVKVGRLIAEALGMKVLPVEDVIEYVNNSDIPSIVRDFGSDYYYALEEDIVPRLGECDNTVIATTGAMALNPALIETLGENAYIVLLLADDNTTLRRIEGDARCYIKADILEKRHSLLRNINVKLINMADVVVDTTRIMPNEAKDIVLGELTRLLSDE